MHVNRLDCIPTGQCNQIDVCYYLLGKSKVFWFEFWCKFALSYAWCCSDNNSDIVLRGLAMSFKCFCIETNYELHSEERLLVGRSEIKPPLALLSYYTRYQIPACMKHIHWTDAQKKHTRSVYSLVLCATLRVALAVYNFTKHSCYKMADYSMHNTELTNCKTFVNYLNEYKFCEASSRKQNNYEVEHSFFPNLILSCTLYINNSNMQGSLSIFSKLKSLLVDPL